MHLTCGQNSSSKIVALGCAARADHAPKPVLMASCQAPRPCRCAMLTPQGGGAWRTTVSRAQDVPKLCGTRVLLLSLGRENADTKDLASCRRLTEQTERRGDSASPHNGSDAKLHGRGPRAEASAARGALHVRRANARRVTPCVFDFPRRLGRRAEAGPCQLLRRVSPPSARLITSPENR